MTPPCICDFELRLLNKFFYHCEMGTMKNEIASVAVFFSSFSQQNPFDDLQNPTFGDNLVMGNVQNIRFRDEEDTGQE